jgi:Putative lumazine-binding
MTRLSLLRLVPAMLLPAALLAQTPPAPSPVPPPSGTVTVPPILPIASPAPSADELAIRATVDRYLHGLKFNDVSSLAKAFRPDAKLYFVKKDGTLGELSQQKWYEGFKASAGKEEPGDLAIVAIDISTDAASVKVVETYPGSRYIDYLSLLKVQGAWWIVNKVYTVQKK